MCEDIQTLLHTLFHSLNYKDRSKNLHGSRQCHTFSFIVYICSIVPYTSRRLRSGIKGLGRGGVYAIIYTMYSMKVTLWLRREQGYSSAQASTDRKAGRLSLPFYSIEFFSYTPL